MGKSNKNILNLFCFIALIIIAILILVNNLLPLVGIKAQGPFFDALSTIKEILILVVVGLYAYYFVVGKTKTWKIIYWIAIALFIIGIILIWF